MSEIYFDYFQKYRMNSRPNAPWDKYYVPGDTDLDVKDLSICKGKQPA